MYLKKKIVIKVQTMNCVKCRARALEVAAQASGVLHAEWKGEEKEELVVIGENVDEIKLAKKLRKKFGSASLQSVGPLDKKES